MRYRLVMLIALAGALFVAGCGNSPEIAPVKGRITYKGKGVPGAFVTFNPDPQHEKDREPGKPGTGYSNDNGEYVLSTFKKLDGALVGKHTITIILDDTNPTPCNHFKKVTREVKPGDNEFNFEMDPK